MGCVCWWGYFSILLKGTSLISGWGTGDLKGGRFFSHGAGMELSSFATHFLETVYKGVFIIYVPGGADLGAGAEKSSRDLGGAETNPVDI